MPNTTNFNFPTPADTDLVKDGASAIRSLGNSIDTAFVDLKGGTTGQVLSKNSNTDLDFTWVAQDDSNAIQNAIVDAKGDLISATAADTPARLAVGADGTYLQADSTTATGLKWGTVSAGGMTLISETTASSLTSLTLGSIPGTYKQLMFIWSGVVHSNNSSGFALRINNDSDASKYPQQAFRFTDSTPTVLFFGTSVVGFASYQTFGEGVNLTDPEWSANGYLLIDNYASTSKDKYFQYHYSYYNNNAVNRNIIIGNGRFDDTTAITSLDIYRTNGTGNFSNQTNTSFRLYGIA